jgi:hypothetical protein
MQEPPGGEPIDVRVHVGVLHEMVVSLMALLLRSGQIMPNEFDEIFARSRRHFASLGVPSPVAGWQDQIPDLLASAKNGTKREADLPPP